MSTDGKDEGGSGAQGHYERLLAGVYGWMIGERGAAIENGRKQLRAGGMTCCLDFSGSRWRAWRRRRGG